MNHTPKMISKNKHGIKDGRQIEFLHRKEYNVQYMCVFVFILSSKLILSCIVMCTYDFRPLLEHSEPKMASKMAASI